MEARRAAAWPIAAERPVCSRKESEAMAQSRRESVARNTGEAGVRSKIEKLRALRLEDMAARQAAGTWGEMSVWEVTHRPTGEILVQLWKGRTEPDLAKLPGKRTAAKWAAEQQQLVDWLMKHKRAGFELAMIAWDLSEAEARKTQQARIAEHRSGGRAVANLATPAAAN
jgi:hypothetical protein